MLMGQKGGNNADLMKMMMSMNNKGNANASNTDMMTMLGNMMNSNNKSGEANNDFSQGGNEQLVSMVTSMMAQNAKNQSNMPKGFTPLKGISTDIINNIIMLMMNAKDNPT